MNSRSSRSDGARPQTVTFTGRDDQTVALHGGVLHLPHLELLVSVPERSDRAKVAIVQGVNTIGQTCSAAVEKPEGHSLTLARKVLRHSSERRQASSPENLADPLVCRLSDALVAVQSSGEGHGALYADALRLAVVVRLLAAGPTRRSPSRSAAGESRRTKALQKWRLKRVLDHIDRHMSAKITLVKLAKIAGLSRMHFAAQFRTATGMSPHEFMIRRRVARAQQLLEDPERSIADVALAVGFRTQSHFTAVFKQMVGETPYKWRLALEDC